MWQRARGLSLTRCKLCRSASDPAERQHVMHVLRAGGSSWLICSRCDGGMFNGKP